MHDTFPNWDEAENLAYSWVQKDVTGHDRFHIERVRKMARLLAKSVGADPIIVEWAALFHDALDEKLTDRSQDREPQINQVMDQAGLTAGQKNSIWQIIRGQSFSKSLPTQTNDMLAQGGEYKPSLEFQVLQDADRLDAIGAIGIARCLAYGARKGQPIHNPNWQPRQNLTQDEYRHGNQTSLNHFYEKLLLLKDRMNTAMAKEIAETRHARMERYLQEFYQEWNGEE